jgi:flagellar basal body-associated protein FliL
MPYGPPPIVVPVTVRPKQSSGCGIAAIVVLVVFLVAVLCTGSLFASRLLITKSSASSTVTSINIDETATADDATASAELTPTPFPPYTESYSPSGANFSEAAQEVITNAQLASEVDSSNRPSELQSTFQSGQTIYLVYKWAQGNTGYVQTRWYYNGESKGEAMSKYIGSNAVGYGYMTGTFYAYGNTGQGTIEVFWCQDAACTHGGLSWIRPFSVTAD